MGDAVQKRKPGVPGSTLKLVAIVAMLIDHFSAILIENYIMVGEPTDLHSQADLNAWFLANPVYARLSDLDTLLRSIGRFGFPIFCFLLIEGFLHTHNLKKYIRNMAIFAVISEIPFDLGFRGKTPDWSYQNVFFTLLVGLLVLTVLKGIENRKWKEGLWLLYFPALAVFGVWMAGLSGKIFSGMLYRKYANFVITRKLNAPVMKWGYLILAFLIAVIAAVWITWKWNRQKKIYFAFGVLAVILGVTLANALKTDYSGFGVLTIVAMYLLRGNYKREMLGGCVVLTVMSLTEVPAFLMVGLAEKYNGERGLSLKYFFYAFYPVHILLLYMIAHFVLHVL